MRLNKFLGETGLCSRREADALIGARRVTVNGTVALIGTQVESTDTVRVDGQIARARSKGSTRVRVYLALNKPVGITCTTEREVRGNIIDFVDHPERIFPIGRLDKDSQGLILLTNDGDIVNTILRAENHHEKEYLVSVDQPVTPEFLRQMAAGVMLDGTRTLPCRISARGKYGFCIILTQGLNRQIRRMCEHLGYTVKTLERIRIMNIRLDRLKIGQWRNLTAAELKGLLPAKSADTAMVADKTKVVSKKPAAPSLRTGRPRRAK
jgi:23S rRNA pseudouridine2604 synthase